MKKSDQNKTNETTKTTETTTTNKVVCKTKSVEQSAKNDTIFNLKEGDNKSDDDQSNSEYNTTETSCSINSDDCIEYDSDISSNDSIFFYSDNDEFIENRFLRINHRPFMKILKNKHQELTNQNGGDSVGGDDLTDKSQNNGNIPQCPSSMSRYINKDIFDKIDKLNNELEVEYNNLKQLLNISDSSADETSQDSCHKYEVLDTACNKSNITKCNKVCATGDDKVCATGDDKVCATGDDKVCDK